VRFDGLPLDGDRGVNWSFEREGVRSL
jgi:hypothetical protein